MLLVSNRKVYRRNEEGNMLNLTDTELVWISSTLILDVNRSSEWWDSVFLTKEEVKTIIDKLNEERIRLDRR